jgi:hypothetical protein
MLLLPVVTKFLASKLRVNCSLSGGPARRAYLSVLISILEGLKESKGLIDISSNISIIDSHMSECLFLVNEESTSEGDSLQSVAFSINKDSVVLGDNLGDISQEGDRQRSEASLLSGLKSKFSVGEVRVYGNSYNLAVYIFYKNIVNFENFYSAWRTPQISSCNLQFQ